MGKRCADILRHTRSDFGFRTLSFEELAQCGFSSGPMEVLEHYWSVSGITNTVGPAMAIETL